MVSIIFLAASQASALGEAMWMVPSSSMSTVAPDSAVIFWMTEPPLPMTSRILSGSIFMVIILGAYLLTSGRGAAMQGSITSSRMAYRASRVMSRASLMISWVRPSFFRSIWMAVMPALVPATLKSISPWKSSTPWMSMKVVKRRCRPQGP